MSRIRSEIVSNNNLVFIILLGGLELGIFSVYYAKLWKKNKAPLILLGVGISYTVFELMGLSAKDVNEFQSYSRPLAHFFIVILGGFTIYNYLGTGQQRINIMIQLAIIGYFSFEIIFMLPINFWINQSSNLILYFIIGRVLIASAFYLYLAFVLWKIGKTRKRLHYGLC